MLKFALSRHSHINRYSDLYKVTGYTSLTIRDADKKVIYYATELKYGREQYDYAMIEFEGNDGDDDSRHHGEGCRDDSR